MQMQFRTRCIPKDQSYEEAILRIHSLTPPQLELETVKELLRHRKLVESEELVYRKWRKAEIESVLSKKEIDRMREYCLRRRNFTLSQQELLSHMIDLLGFIPKIPNSHDCLGGAD